MRLAGRIKMGYYPTPLSVIERIRTFLTFDDSIETAALDPCCGEGLALQALVMRTNCRTYGIEIDELRATAAKDRLDHVLKCPAEKARITNGCFSILFLNPPYDQETLNDGVTTNSERKEKRFLRDTVKYLTIGGLLIYIIPQARMSRSIINILSHRFRSLHVYRFPPEEFKDFGQVVIFGIKKERPEPNEDARYFLDMAAQPDIADIPFAEEPMFEVPPARPVTLFKSSVIDMAALERIAKGSPLWKTLYESARIEKDHNLRPLLPLHQGHIALMLANGRLNGIVGQGKDRHVVKGTVRKIVQTHEEIDEEGVTVREIDQYQVSIKILTRDGDIRTLV